MMEIDLPDRIMREIQRVRPEDVVLNLGLKEGQSVTISSDVFKKILEESIRRRRK